MQECLCRICFAMLQMVWNELSNWLAILVKFAKSAHYFYLAISQTYCNLFFALIEMKNCSLVIRIRYLSDLGKIWPGQYIRLKPRHSEMHW